MIDGKFEFKRVRRRFRRPLRTGAGPVEAVERILLRTQSADGVGYGEIAPWPGFPTESTETAVEALRSAQGSLSHLSAVVAASPGLPCLAAALSSCRRWDSIAAFGGTLPCAGLLSDDPDDVSQKTSAGYRTLKLKVLPETTIADVRALLARFDGTLRLDANGSLDLQSARRWVEFARNEPRVEFVEQPLAVGHPGYASLGHDKVAFERVLDYALLGTWGFYGLTSIAVIVLRVRHPELPRPYLTVGYPYIPLIFSLVAVLFCCSIALRRPEESLLGLALLLLGVPFYLYFKGSTPQVKP